jgi:hypothetical protein
VSSCKNCHEVQAKDPVNNDGKSWHTAHAFGDFCYICHGGNQQAADETAAHTGLVPPLSDVKASCQSCHANDLEARVQVYASALGVTPGAAAAPAAGSSAAATPTPAAASSAPAPTSQPAAAAAPAPASGDGTLVNYVQRYDENALGQHPTNWGNLIAVLLIAAILLGGGILVARREGWVRISFKEMKPLEKEYPTDVVELAAELSHLDPAARGTLRRLITKPQAASNLLSALDELSAQDPSDSKN